MSSARIYLLILDVFVTVFIISIAPDNAVPIVAFLGVIAGFGIMISSMPEEN